MTPPPLDAPSLEASPPLPAPPPREDGFPAPNTPEWDVKNRRRYDLIVKLETVGLTPEEQREYDDLDRRTGEAMLKALPAPTLHTEELDRIEARLAAQEKEKAG
ncbi:MAG: hypothetical protein K2W96_22550 [Gemmataceae bacterium]|nr:hypothetical protein [Gemmataceae bacterium]